MLASTVQFSNNTPHPRPATTTATLPGAVTKTTLACSLRTQQCTDITPQILPRGRTPARDTCQRSTREQPCPTYGDKRPLATPTPRLFGAGGQMLLRKEVIQPHLPVRLPCYDLVPIASPTFDGSPHKGWATGFGCYRLS